MIIYIIFVHTLLYVMVLQVGKICVLDLPVSEIGTDPNQERIRLHFRIGAEFKFLGKSRA